MQRHGINVTLYKRHLPTGMSIMFFDAYTMPSGHMSVIYKVALTSMQRRAGHMALIQRRCINFMWPLGVNANSMLNSSQP